jgi:hypothetical protein
MRNIKTLEILRGVSVFIFATALLALFFIGNYLMINRPNSPNPSEGFIYVFFGKGAPIYISRVDYIFLVSAILVLIGSMISANRFHRMIR